MSVPRVVAVIPARFASTRLPGKPLADIAGKPMIRHVYERAAAADTVEDVIVATDDDRIASAVASFGGKAMMTPASIRTGTDRIAWLLPSLPGADILVNVQGDEPMLHPAMIDEAVAPLLDDHAIDVATLARPLADPADLANPSVVKVVCDLNGCALLFSRSAIPYGRDLAPELWVRRHRYHTHVGLYAYRRTVVAAFPALEQTPLEQMEQLEQLRLMEHGYRIRVVVTGHDSVPVDTPDDLERVRGLLAATP